jgi:hypothetical protein
MTKKFCNETGKYYTQASFLYLGLNYQTNLDMLTMTHCPSLNDDKKVLVYENTPLW